MVQKQATRWRGIRGGAWGIGSGLVGSLCCIGPSAAILLGLGSSSALFGLQVDQRLALGSGVLLLVGGCLLAVRNTRICNLHPRALWRQIAIMLMTGVAAYVLLGVLAPWAALRQEQADRPEHVSAAVPVHLRQAIFTIEKMDCPPCVAHLSSLLARKPFVERFEAQAGNEQLLIIYDSSQIDSIRLLAIIPQQYRAVLKQDSILP